MGSGAGVTSYWQHICLQQGRCPSACPVVDSPVAVQKLKWWQSQIFTEILNDPNLVLKLTPINYWARLWPPLKAFQGPGPGYLKYHPHLWTVVCESKDPTQRSCFRSLSKAAEWVCTGSSQSSVPHTSSLCFLFWTGMAVGASKEWKQNALMLTVLRRGSEFCGTNAGWMSPRATAQGLNVPLGSGAQPARVRRYKYWQLNELRALFHYLSQDLWSEQSQKEISNNYKTCLYCYLQSC